MKFVALLSAPVLAASLVIQSPESGCVSHAENFIKKPEGKDRLVQRAMDHCAVDKKIEDKNFVCPHYRALLDAAFRRQSTTENFDSSSFCSVVETYVSEIKNAGRVPNVGKGDGFDFKLLKACKPTVEASFAKGQKSLPAKSAPDFWYALCMNQDCAHFLPSRTRWCTKSHSPTHAQSVCEAVRHFAHEDAHTMEKNLNHELDADQICNIYDDFVESTHVNVEAYNHVVHGTENHPVPSPESKKRALDSAVMKNEASKNKLRDASGEPVKSGAASASMLLGFVSFAALWSR